MITDRLGSGPSLVGNSHFPEASSRKMENQEKAPESFADLVEKKSLENKKPQEGKTPQEGKKFQEAKGSTDVKQTSEKSMSQKQTESKPSNNSNVVKRPEGGRVEAGSRTQKDLSVRRNDDGDESEIQDSIKNSEKSDLKTDSKALKSLTPKQRAMQEFMDSIESEFSIPPERIVVAMAKLSDQEMLKSPEETASQVISKLELTPEDSERAEAHYMSMLSQLRTIENRKPEKMLELTPEQASWLQAAGGMTAVGKMAAMQKPVEGQPTAILARDKRLALEDSLSRLSQKFFMSPTDKVSESKIISNTAIVNAEESIPLDQTLLQKGEVNPLMDKSEGAFAIPEFSKFNGIQNGKPDLSEIPKAVPESYQELSQKLRTLSQATGDLSRSLMATPENQLALKSELGLNHLQIANKLDPNMMQNANIADSAMQNQMMIPMGFSMSQMGQDSQQSFDARDFQKSFQKDSSVTKKDSEFFIQPQQQDDGKTTLKNDFAIANPKSGPEHVSVVRSPDASQNMQQVMNQAQIMIKRGGGDAIVRLNPEGLGEVHLKVSVADGKVNLQMSTETKEAKSLIESSLRDLKSTLNSHDLKVDQVKIDVSNQASAENSNSHKQNSSDGGFKFDQQREQARQFLGNFRDENSANRGGFFEMPGLKAYNSRKGPEPLKPSTDTNTSSRRYTGEGRGSSIDLVV